MGLEALPSTVTKARNKRRVMVGEGRVGRRVVGCKALTLVPSPGGRGKDGWLRYGKETPRRYAIPLFEKRGMNIPALRATPLWQGGGILKSPL